MKKNFSVVVAFVSTFLIASSAMAQSGNASGKLGYAALAAALVMGLAAFGCAMGQGRAAAAALEGIARNPSAQSKVFVPFILGMALIESLCVLSLVISIMLIGKI